MKKLFPCIALAVSLMLTISCSKDKMADKKTEQSDLNTAPKRKKINIGDVTYDGKKKVFYNAKGEVMNLDSYRKNGEILTVNSLVIWDDYIEDDTNCSKDNCAYKVYINRHIWWGAAHLDQDGHIGISESLQAFVFRPGPLYMDRGTFVYRGNDCKSHRFLEGLLEEDPTSTIEVTDCTGPFMKYTPDSNN